LKKIRVRLGAPGLLILATISAALALVMWSHRAKPSAATPNDIATLRSLQARVQAAARKASPAIVAIKGAEPGDDKPHLYQPYASGVIISADGLVLSQFHVSHRYAWNSGESVRSRKPGERTKVVLNDGRELQAELLGADVSYDFSLLQLPGPGPYPYVPLAHETKVRSGDWVLKLGHPIGYRRDRPPVVRLGRVLLLGDGVFVTDCNITGGDSGGPFVDLDGELVGMVGNSEIPPGLKTTAIPLPEMLFSCDAISIIQRHIPSMLQRKISPDDISVRKERYERVVNAKDILPVDKWTQGATTALAFRNISGPATPSVVEIRDANGRQVATGTIVAPDGWILTLASLLPTEPKCRLPDRKVVSARVAGVNPEFDLALLKVPASNLHPTKWASNGPGTMAGAILAAPSASPTQARPLLGVGIVSVTARDLPGPFPKQREHPKVRAEEPRLGGMPTAQGFRLDTIDAAIVNAGIRQNDILVSIGERPIRTQEAVTSVADGHRPGERVVVREIRDMKPLSFSLALGAKPLTWSKPYADFPTLFEHDMPLLPSQCGGPVFDLDGKAVGITVFRGEYGCMAIPANCIQRLLPELQSGKSAVNRRNAPGKHRTGKHQMG
jgi:serine protease Do